MRLIALAMALALAQSAAPDRSTAANPQTVAVRIDLVATDARGRPVDNLKAADVVVREDGVVQPAAGIRIARPVDDDGRLIGIYLDEYHVSPDQTGRVRDALTQFIDQRIGDRDQLVVMKPLDSVLSIRPTRDRDAARAAILAFEGRKGLYEPRNAYERNFMAGVPERIERARNQVALSAINAIAVHFGHYPDQRKTLIVVSEGMERGERHRGLEFLPTAETIARSANRFNVAIYAVDPGPAPQGSDGSTLQTLALETVGGVITSDLDDGLRRAMEDATRYYLIEYSASVPDDGKFHAVDVQVKRPSAQLRSRKGYFAPSPDDTLRAELLARINQPKPVVPLEPAPHVSPLIRPWFGTSRGDSGKTKVTFVWEPAARLTGERIRRTPTRVVLTALAPNDAVLFEGPVNPTGPALVDDPPGPGNAVPSRATFDVPPGRLRLRIAIQDAAQQVIDNDVRTISVRDLGTGVSIGTPEVLRARNAREFRTLDNALAIPAASREFSRTERLLIRFEAYGSAGAEVAVTARLLSRMGPMRDLQIEPGTGGQHLIDVPLAGLATGEYLIELSASSGGGEAKDVIDFRVTT